MGWFLISSSQINAVTVIFLLITDLKNIFMTSFILALVIFDIVFINKLEHCYDLIRSLAADIRKESVNAGN